MSKMTLNKLAISIKESFDTLGKVMQDGFDALNNKMDGMSNEFEGMKYDIKELRVGQESMKKDIKLLELGQENIMLKLDTKVNKLTFLALLIISK